MSTIGIEFETDNMTLSELNRKVYGWGFADDASIRSPLEFSNLENLYITHNQALNLKQSKSKNTMGVELVSQVYDTENDNILGAIQYLTKALTQMGEPNESQRAGIHIHVGYKYSLENLKSILVLGQFLEDSFYLIGGMGYKYRGIDSDGVYCRPITSFGPPCIYTGYDYYSQIFNVVDLINSSSLSSFWKKFGNITRTDKDHLNKYHPSRYTWLNLFSLLYHGTLEFRVFNKTLNPYYINSCVNLVEKFAKFTKEKNTASIINAGFNKVNSVFNERKKEDIINDLIHFCEVVELNSADIVNLVTICNRSPEVHLGKYYIYSHLRNAGTYWVPDGEYIPSKIEEVNIKKPKFTDIHVLNGR